MKKIISVFLSLLMTAVLALPAFADGDDILAESVKAAERAGGRYYYNYLGTMRKGAAYRELYDKLYDFALRVMESDADFETDGFIMRFDADSPVSWEYDPGDLTYYDILEVVNLFCDENPYFYFINVSTLGSELRLVNNYSFNKAETRKETFAKINEYLRSYSEAENYTDPYEKAKFLHDKLCLDMTYTYAADLHTEYNAWETNIYGAVMYRTGVCNGYAHAFSLIAQYYGFSAPIVCGSAGADVNDPSTMGAHVWNILSLDGERYYYVDTTWDDADDIPDEWSEYYGHEFFLCGSENVRGHVRSTDPAGIDLGLVGDAAAELFLPGLSKESYPEYDAPGFALPAYTAETEAVTETSGTEAVTVGEETSDTISGTVSEAATSETVAETTTAEETSAVSSAEVTTAADVPAPAKDGSPIIIFAVIAGVLIVIAAVTVLVIKRK